MINISELSAHPNVAELLSQEELDDIGRELVNAIEIDDLSRGEWLANQEEGLKLATQLMESKSTPWPNASNIKYPLITTAAIQFHARALPGLINHERPVHAKILGYDPQYTKLKRAERVSRYMSWQLLEEQTEWMDETDRLLFVLAIIGLCYKKVYHSELDNRRKCILVLPKELIVNYNAQEYTRARMTHVRGFDANEVIEYQRAGLFLDIDIDTELEEADNSDPINEVRDEIIGLTPSRPDIDADYIFYESHCWLDLDEDGYKEPYIVTIDSRSMKVLRISARWTEEDIQYAEDGRVGKITATEHFIAYKFLPDPCSSMYALGFSNVVGSMNAAVDTLANQLVDAGTLSNMQSGFIGRGAKLRGGATSFRPGEWKLVNTTGDDLRKSIFPMPVRDPSPVLFQLLGMFVTAGQQITSVSDMMMGENPGQNQKATTTMAVLEQGLSVFKGIYKRIHRSLQAELRLLYKFNYIYLAEENYHMMLDDIMPQQITTPQGPIPVNNHEGSREDFNPKDLNILPTADPSIISDAQRMAKASSLMEKLGAGLPLNPFVVTKKLLEAERQEDIQELMTLPPPKPSMEEREYELEIEKTKLDAFKAYFDAILKTAQAEAAEEGTQLSTYQAIVDDKLKVEQFARDGQQNVGEKVRPGSPSGQGSSVGGGAESLP